MENATASYGREERDGRLTAAATSAVDARCRGTWIAVCVGVEVARVVAAEVTFDVVRGSCSRFTGFDFHWVRCCG